MQETLDIAMELNTEMANMYPCQALPGSPMYSFIIKNGCAFPDSYEGYAFLSYESQPLPTKYVSSAYVLRLHDEARQKDFTNSAYLNLVEQKFGLLERKNIEDMVSIRLKHKILGN